MSEQQSEPTSGETGTIGTGPAAPDMSQPKAPVTAAASVEVESPLLAPDQEETSPKPDAPREMTKVELPKVEAPKVETTRVEATRTEPPPIPGKLLVMSPGDRAWNGEEAGAKPEAAGEASSGKRRMSAMAAVVALATVAGAVGGALATDRPRIFDGWKFHGREYQRARIPGGADRCRHCRAEGRASSTPPRWG